MVPEASIVHVVFPHLKRSLNISRAVFRLGLPDGLQRLSFRAIHVRCVLLFIAPLIEHLTQELLPHETVAQVILLDLHFNRLEGALMPLFDCDSHFELAETLNDLHVLLERIVALGVELAVLEELIHRLLLSLLKHVLQQAESHLGDE